MICGMQMRIFLKRNQGYEVWQTRLEIYLNDLTPEAQRNILRFLRVKNAKEANLDVFPLFVLVL